MRLKGKILTRNEATVLTEFYSTKSSKSLVTFYLDRSPSFFDALSVEGDNSRVFAIIDEETGVVAGASIRSIRDCHVNGKPEKVGYISSIRIDEKYRGSLVFGKLMTELKSIEETDLKLYLCSIMDDNKIAHSIFLSKHPLLPHFKQVGKFETLIFKPSKKLIAIDRSLEITTAKNFNINALIEFLNREGSNKQLFPIFRKEDFENTQIGALKGIDLNEIFIATRNSQIVGTMALWNQCSFRRWMLYTNKRFKLFQPFANTYSKIKGIPTIPDEKKAIPLKYIALICVENNQQEIFNALLNYTINAEYSSRKKSLLILGYFKTDPLFFNLKISALKLKSTIFTFVRPENKSLIESINFDNPYIETATL